MESYENRFKLNPDLIEKYKQYLIVEDTRFPGLKEIKAKDTGKRVGTLEATVDGSWFWFPNTNCGAFSAYTLLGIGAILHDLTYGIK
jgi:hypothetical protein